VDQVTMTPLILENSGTDTVDKAYTFINTGRGN